LKDTSARGTIHFTRYINGIETQIPLLDNFVQPKLIKSLKLPVNPTPTFQLGMGKLASHGQVHNIPIHIKVIAYRFQHIVVTDLVLGTH